MLNQYLGLKGIMVGAEPGSAETPRAHITNMAALGRFPKKYHPLPRDLHLMQNASAISG